MHYVLMLALLLCACSSSAPTTYRQSAFPAAPAFSPVEDAPIFIGHPGYVGEPRNVERSPHTRVLPPTKERGLWAGDTRASLSPMLKVLGVGVPMPESFESGINPAAFCATLADNSVGADHGIRSAIDALSLNDRLCFVTQAMLTCLAWRDLQRPVSRSSDGPAAKALREAFIRDIGATSARLGRHADLVCGGHSRALGALLDRWWQAAQPTGPRGLVQ